MAMSMEKRECYPVGAAKVGLGEHSLQLRQQIIDLLVGDPRRAHLP